MELAMLTARLGRQDRARQLAAVAAAAHPEFGTEWLSAGEPIDWTPELLPVLLASPRPSNPYDDIRELSTRVEILVVHGHRHNAGVAGSEIDRLIGNPWHGYAPPFHTFMPWSPPPRHSEGSAVSVGPSKRQHRLRKSRRSSETCPRIRDSGCRLGLGRSR